MPENNQNSFGFEDYVAAYDRIASNRRAEPAEEAVATPINLERAFSSWYSSDSDEDEKPEFEYIQEYNYVPKIFNFHKVKSSEEDLFLGVEIEVDNGGKKDEVAQEVIEILGDENVYCKHDGSLSNGFEIVTHPATLYYHKSLDYKRAFDRLVKLGYRAHDVNTCGLHVHFNKTYFGKDKFHQDMNISKLLYIFEKFYQQIELIARRKHNDYARRYYMEDNETVFDMYSKAKSANKYGAINLKHDDTIEIRIFKGTLNYDTYMITLEFVKNIVKIVKNISIYEIQFVSWNTIFNKFSPELKKYYCERAEQKRQEDLKKEEERKKKEEERQRERQRDMARIVSSDRVVRSEPRYFDFSSFAPRDLTFNWSPYVETPSNPAASIESTGERSTADIEAERVETRRRIRNTRNAMERLSLERQLNELDAELRELRPRAANN